MPYRPPVVHAGRATAYVEAEGEGLPVLKATSNEDPNKLARVRDLLKGEMQVAAKPLPADYLWEAHGKVVACEVKWSVGDLLSSLQTVGEAGGPRLAVEVRKLFAFADVPILLTPVLRNRGDGKVVLYETGRESKASGWDYNSVKGILADLALYGCIVDEWDGDIACRLAQWYYVSREPGHEWIRQRGRPEFISLDPAYTTAVWALCAFAGVGPEKADALLREFGSVASICNESCKSLQRCQGIGPKVANSLYRGLHGCSDNGDK